MTRIAHFALIATAMSLAACANQSVSEPSSPDVQQRQLGQLSAGGGIAGYDFYMTEGGVPKRVGSLLVIEDAGGAGYFDETEYWRFDPLALDSIETGDVDTIEIDFIGKSKSFDQALVDHFEDGTTAWTAWNVNRLFDLASDPTIVWNEPANGHVLYTMEGKGWGKAEGKRITYYLELDFNIGEAYPEMIWYIDYDDFQAWEMARGADTRAYEVRLSHGTELQQTAVGVGYELKTIK